MHEYIQVHLFGTQTTFVNEHKNQNVLTLSAAYSPHRLLINMSANVEVHNGFLIIIFTVYIVGLNNDNLIFMTLHKTYEYIKF